ncbi:LPXTG-motif cell wall-anchored protein [Blastococcus colisei]|uniref:LPXTG-motif cell wall-anchored protein n=1 Tax=Blastococcus colisei TaxID=1564162 RepID=A0A543PCR7_9ACTN|nr:LPXTG cell wall anchor domain-containing protein [Blastococcus colisei]TQN41882.1 LPXTG-motif cell wall-anchored protein [Blastococcus colisei]
MPRPFLTRLATGSLLGVVLAGASLATAPAAGAAPSTPVLSPSSVTAGQSFTVSGAGCTPSTDPTNPIAAVAFIDLGPDAQMGIGDGAEPAADGSWTVSLTIPEGFQSGTYDVISGCADYLGTYEFQYPTTTVTVGRPVPPAPATCGSNCQVVAPGAKLSADRAVVPGELRNLALYGYLPFEQVTLVLHSTPQTLGTFTADANGIVVVAFRAPEGTTAGDHTLKVTRADGSVVSYAITIAAAKEQLASTGADVTVPLMVGGALLAAGGGALVVARRRNAGATQV